MTQIHTPSKAGSMALVSDHDSEEGFGEDVVPLLTSTLHAVVQVVPRSCHRTVNLVNLSLCLPLGTHVGEEMHVVKWLMDGDVGEPALQPAALAVVREGAPDSIINLPITNLVKLTLLEVAESKGDLIPLPLVIHQS